MSYLIRVDENKASTSFMSTPEESHPLPRGGRKLRPDTFTPIFSEEQAGKEGLRAPPRGATDTHTNLPPPAAVPRLGFTWGGTNLAVSQAAHPRGMALGQTPISLQERRGYRLPYERKLL